MNHSDIAALMKGMAPVVRDLFAASVEPLLQRIGDLEREVAASRSVDHSETIRVAVQEAVAALPAAKDGLDGQPGKDGANGMDAVLPDIDAMVRAAVDAIPRPVDGKSVTIEDVAPLIEEAVRSLPPAQDGRSVTVEELRPTVEEVARALVSEAVAAIPVPKDGVDGKEGPPGKLPVAKEWVDGVHRESDVVTYGRATYQATRDTGKEPPHEDWQCIAAAGRDGTDGRSFRIRGTHIADGEYLALDVISLNGAAFVAKTDDPGPCPGEGWQLMASQGKTGKPGDRGAPGPKGDRGAPGAPVVAVAIDDQGLMTLANGDGSTIECDFYPVLAKVQ